MRDLKKKSRQTNINVFGSLNMVLIHAFASTYSQSMRFHWMPGTIMEIPNIGMVEIRYFAGHIFDFFFLFCTKDNDHFTRTLQILTNK